MYTQVYEQLKNLLEIPGHHIHNGARQSGRTTAIAQLMREQEDVHIVVTSEFCKRHFVMNFPDLKDRVTTINKLIFKGNEIPRGSKVFLDTEQLAFYPLRRVKNYKIVWVRTDE